MKVEVAKTKKKGKLALEGHVGHKGGRGGGSVGKPEKHRWKDVLQVRKIKDRDEKVLTGSTMGMERWKENFEKLMIEAEREHTVEEEAAMDQDVAKISINEMMKKRMKSGKAVVPHSIF